MPVKGYLIIKLDGQEVKRVEIHDPGLTIGKAPENDLSLADPQVSRRHAEIRCEVGGLTLTDLGSMNGTFLDGDRLLPKQPRLFSNGMTVRIGLYSLTYYADGADLPGASAYEENGLPEIQAADLMPAVIRAWRFEKIPRPTSAVDAPPLAEPSRYLQYLPAIFQEVNLRADSSDHRSHFLNRFLKIFETIWEPLEQRQDHISMYFSPHTCPTSFLPWLASWFDLRVDSRLPESRLRLLVAEGIEMHAWRGTKYGLSRLIEIYTGASPEITSPPAQPFVFHIKIQLPGDDAVVMETYGGREKFVAFVKELIDTYKPAYAGYTLEVKQ